MGMGSGMSTMPYVGARPALTPPSVLQASMGLAASAQIGSTSGRA
jgi:hypothetical protein